MARFSTGTTWPGFQAAVRVKNRRDEHCTESLVRYGMVESRKRLEEAGFHPEVTHRSLEKLENELVAGLKKKINRPIRKNLLTRRRNKFTDPARSARRVNGRFRSNDDRRGRGAIMSFGPLTKGPWYPTERLNDIVSEARREKNVSEEATHGRKKQLSLESMISHNHLGPKILNQVFGHGHRVVMNLALTSSTMYKLVTRNANQWDFSSGFYKVKSPSNVFVATMPTQYIRDFKNVLSKYSFPVNSRKWVQEIERLEAKKHPDAQKLRAIGEEQAFFQEAKWFSQQCWRANGPYWATPKGGTKIDPRTPKDAVEWWDGNKQAMNIMGSLKTLDNMWSANQFEGSGYQEYRMPLSLAMEALFKLMREMHTVSTFIQVVHLHDVPLVDRRMFAVMLRGMPHVVQVGVYRCPLIHFGDVIPILDLIYKINTGRRKKKMPAIKAFDFYPNFEDGMPYEHENAATYGLSFDPLPMDIGQRGLYGILLKAVMKAKAMDLDQLFDRDGALMHWLAKVPNAPLGPFCFLDALYRYLEVDFEDPDYANKTAQATYDLLKPVRVATDTSLGMDWPRYYLSYMGNQYFCSSCGYETFRELFPRDATRFARHKRICSACKLQRALDAGNEHCKAWKLHVLDIVCPFWLHQKFNKNAPLYDNGAELIRLKSTKTVRDPEIAADDAPPKLVRDNKCVFDSLVDLPSLEQVAQGWNMARLWKDAVALGFRYDLQRRGILELRRSYSQQSNGVPAFPPSRWDGGAPDHEDELQLPVVNRGGIFFDHRKALDMANGMKRNGW